MSNDSTSKTIKVALALCIVCSVVVSTAAVLLKPLQEANIQEDRKRNILAAAGMLEPGISIDEQFADIEAHAVDLRTGAFTDAVDSESFNPIAAARDPAQSERLDSATDTANIRRREDVTIVYLAGGRENPERIILPIRGAGLWGQMYGFLALEGDAKTIAGIGFYQHKETPGLGGEINNPRWQALWPGKQAYSDGEVTIEVIKGVADRSGPRANYEIDGLSGATLTTRGVDNTVQFWLGENGFGPFLANLKAGEA